MRSLKYFLPTLIAYMFTAILYKNFTFFNIFFGAIWINIIYYWVLLFGLFFSLFNLKFKNKSFKILYSSVFFLCVFLILILAIDSIDNLKYNSILCFFTLFSGTTLILNYRHFDIFYFIKT